jgi:hypothetical protein
MTSAPAAGPAAFALRAGFVDNQRSAEKILAVERGDCFFRFLVVADFGEAEAARLPGEPVAEQRERIRRNPDF